MSRDLFLNFGHRVGVRICFDDFFADLIEISSDAETVVEIGLILVYIFPGIVGLGLEADGQLLFILRISCPFGLEEAIDVWLLFLGFS